MLLLGIFEAGVEKSGKPLREHKKHLIVLTIPFYIQPFAGAAMIRTEASAAGLGTWLRPVGMLLG